MFLLDMQWVSLMKTKWKREKFRTSYVFEKACGFLNKKDLLKSYAGSQ